MTNLGVLGESFPGFGFSSARDINEMGHVVGASSVPGGQHAFLWTPSGGMQDLGTLGGQNSVARAINDLGHIVGQSDTATGEEHAFLWTPELEMQDLGTLGGTSSSAADINSLGQVVGRAALANGDEHAFLWTEAGGMQDLGTLGGEGSRSQAEGINDAGEVVGLFTGNDDRAFYWTASGGMIELPTLTPEGETAGRAINSSGQIAGYGDIATGDAHAVVWNRTDNPPTPEAQIVALQASLEDLVTAGILKAGQANGLSRPLQNASRSLANGQTASACSQLAGFVVEVTRKVRDGALSSGEGSALTEAATGIRVALGCS
jgi:probable HAF family extracellular repeat protein